MLKKFFQSIFLSLCFLFVVGLFLWGMQWFSNSSENFFQLKLSHEQSKFLGSVSYTAEGSNLPKEFPYKNQDVEKLEVNAESAISVQNNFANPEKILFEKNGEGKVPIASLTKLMTAVIVLENFDLSKNVKISKTAEEQDTRKLLKAGESFAAKDLLYDMLIESNNSAAYAFSETMGYDSFIKAMNVKANEIGLKNTYFSSPTGLVVTNYSTAKDLVVFAEYLLNQNNPVIQITSIPEFNLYDSKGNFHHKVRNLNELLFDPDVKDRIVAGKTGETKDAGECLLLILKAPENKGYLINIVLNAKDRFFEMKRIIKWEDKAYIWK